jgi:hypothetical protein
MEREEARLIAEELAKLQKSQSAPEPRRSPSGNDSGSFGFNKTVSNARSGIGRFTGFIGDAGGSVASFTKSVSGAAPVIGALGEVVGDGIGFLEETNVVFQKLSKVGAGFNGDLGALRAAAAQTRLPLDQFANLVGRNAEALAGLGGGVNNGAKRFAELSRAMFEDGQVISGMTNLGYTLEEANDFLLDNANLLRRQAMLEGMTDGQVAQATLRMAENIAFMAEITGESAEQQRQDLIDAQRDGRTQAALRLAEQQGATAVQESFSQAFNGLEAAGPAAQALYQDYLQAGAPLSDMTKSFEALNPAVASQIRSIANLTDSQMSAEEKRIRIAQLLDKANIEAAKSSTSRTNLEIASRGQINQTAQYQADVLASQQDYIDGIEAQRVQMERDLGRSVSTDEAGAELLRQTRERIAGQTGGAAPGQEISAGLNQATIDLANSASKVNIEIGRQLSSNTKLQDEITLGIASITTAADLMAEAANKALGLLPGEVDENRIQENNFKAVLEPLIENNALLTRIVNIDQLEDLMKALRDPNATPETIQSEFDKFRSTQSGRAIGGPIEAGNYYKVGEQGPETILAGFDGTVIPNMQRNLRSIARRSESALGQVDTSSMIDSLREQINKASNGSISTTKMEELLDNLNQSMLQLVRINNNVATNTKNTTKAFKGAGNLLSGVTSR